MATVPLIQDTEQLQTGTGRQRMGADASAFGATPARAMGEVKQGLDAVSQTALKIDDDFNEADARDLSNQLETGLRERLYNQTSGYLTSQLGRAAVDGRVQAETDIASLADQIGARARSPRARAMFQQLAQRQTAGALADVATHAARQQTAYEDSVFEAGLSQSVDGAVAAFGDPGAVHDQMERGVQTIEELARRRGWAPEVTQQRIEDFRSDVMQRVIVQLAGVDYAAAEQAYNEWRPRLSAQDAGELLTTMRAVRRQAEDQVIDEAWTYVARGAAIPPDLWERVPGRARIDIQNERRRRIEGGANVGDRTLIEDLTVMAVADPDRFARTDLQSVRGQLGSSYQSLAVAQARLRAGDEPQTAEQQRTTYSALESLASVTLAPYGLNLSPQAADRRSDHQVDARANAFRAALLRELQNFQAANNGQSPTPEESQILIGRAWVSLGRAVAPERARVQGNAGREGAPGTRGEGRRRGTQVAPTTQTVVPYDALPREFQAGGAFYNELSRRLGRAATYGETENAYAAYVTAPENETADQFLARILRR